jgi:hypothetical protein
MCGVRSRKRSIKKRITVESIAVKAAILITGHVKVWRGHGHVMRASKLRLALAVVAYHTLLRPRLVIANS